MESPERIVLTFVIFGVERLSCESEDIYCSVLMRHNEAQSLPDDELSISWCDSIARRLFLHRTRARVIVAKAHSAILDRYVKKYIKA